LSTYYLVKKGKVKRNFSFSHKRLNNPPNPHIQPKKVNKKTKSCHKKMIRKIVKRNRSNLVSGSSSSLYSKSQYEQTFFIFSVFLQFGHESGSECLEEKTGRRRNILNILLF